MIFYPLVGFLFLTSTWSLLAGITFLLEGLHKDLAISSNSSIVEFLDDLLGRLLPKKIRSKKILEDAQLLLAFVQRKKDLGLQLFKDKVFQDWHILFIVDISSGLGSNEFSSRFTESFLVLYELKSSVVFWKEGVVFFFFTFSISIFFHSCTFIYRLVDCFSCLLAFHRRILLCPVNHVLAFSGSEVCILNAKALL